MRAQQFFSKLQLRHQNSNDMFQHTMHQYSGVVLHQQKISISFFAWSSPHGSTNQNRTPKILFFETPPPVVASIDRRRWGDSENRIRKANTFKNCVGHAHCVLAHSFPLVGGGFKATNKRNHWESTQGK